MLTAYSIAVIFNKFIGVITPPLLFVFSIIARQKILKGSDKFKSKWGSLFLEFKNDKGFLSSQYYLLYFTRRVAFAFSQIFLNSILKVQGAINIFFSILALTHLLYYRPFKDNSILISNIVGEISMTLVMVLIYALLWKLDDSTKGFIEKTVIFSVLSSILLQMIISIYSFYKNVQLLWRKIEKIRAMDIVTRFEIVKNEIITTKK